jgi:hypothetical protein
MNDSTPMRHHTGVTVVVPSALQQIYQRQAYAPVPQYRAPIPVATPILVTTEDSIAPKIKINDGSVTAKTLVDGLKIPFNVAKKVVANKPYGSLNELSEKVDDYQWNAFTEVFDFSPMV